MTRPPGGMVSCLEAPEAGARDAGLLQSAPGPAPRAFA